MTIIFLDVELTFLAHGDLELLGASLSARRPKIDKNPFILEKILLLHYESKSKSSMYHPNINHPCRTKL